jgi:hypothetical protein
VARRPGRKPGLPKVPGSGRQKGKPNSITRDVKELILSTGKPVKLLLDVAAGKRVRVGSPTEPRYVYPNVEQRMAAAKTLLAKICPDLQSVSAELSGPDGQPIRTEELGYTEAARRIAFLLVAGREKARAEGAPLTVIEGGAVERPVYHQPEPAPAPQPRPMLPAYQPPPPDDDAALAARREERLALENEAFALERQRHPRHVVITKRNR